MCQLLDYGQDGDDFIMVLHAYSGSLKAWRAQMPTCPDRHLRMYLHIFRDIVSCVQVGYCFMTYWLRISCTQSHLNSHDLLHSLKYLSICKVQGD